MSLQRIGANRKPSEIAEEIVVQNTPTGPKVVKMGQVPTISPAEEKQSICYDLPYKVLH
jgi:hypothetical protein